MKIRGPQALDNRRRKPIVCPTLAEVAGSEMLQQIA